MLEEIALHDPDDYGDCQEMKSRVEKDRTETCATTRPASATASPDLQ